MIEAKTKVFTPNSGGRRPKIAYVTNTSTYFVSHRLDLAKAAADIGWDVHVLTPNGAGVPQIHEARLAVHPIPFYRRTLGPIGEIKGFLVILSTLRRLRPDLVHCIALKSAIFGVTASRLANVPRIIITIAGLGHLFVKGSRLKSAAVWLFCRALAIIFRTKRLRAIFQNNDDRDLFVRNGIVTAERTIVIHGSGVDTDVYKPVPRPPRDEILVVLASRMLWSKGVGLFVDAASSLATTFPTLRFALVGGKDSDNPDFVPEATLRGWVEDGLIEWWGHRPDMIGVLNDADIVVLPTYYREGVPKILIEAASAGIPIITTDSPGCRDIVIHNANGILIPIKNLEALCTAISTLATNEQLRIDMGKRGRQLVTEKFSLNTVIARTIQEYAWDGRQTDQTNGPS